MKCLHPRPVTVFLALLLTSLGSLVEADISITKIEPTMFFPKVGAGEPLRQLANLSFHNTGPDTNVRVRISIKGKEPYFVDIGQAKSGSTTKDIHILDVEQPVKMVFELYEQGKEQPADTLEMTWQPQRKWKDAQFVANHL